MKISIVFNCDSRIENNMFQGNNLTGVANDDMIVDSLINKIKFFEGFDKEIIVHLDRHKYLDAETLMKLQELSDTLLIRKHTDETNFNCYNYLRALQLATGDYVCHIDQDTCCFTSSPAWIYAMIKWANEYSFVSYPSYWSPRAVYDESFGKRTWASTRFFICKREVLKFDELYKCVEEPEYGYAKYGDSPRRCNWVEHFLTLINNDSCFYPPMDIPKIAIFSWGTYTKGTLKELNNMRYEQVEYWLKSHPIVYPCDVHC